MEDLVKNTEDGESKEDSSNVISFDLSKKNLEELLKNNSITCNTVSLGENFGDAITAKCNGFSNYYMNSPIHGYSIEDKCDEYVPEKYELKEINGNRVVVDMAHVRIKKIKERSRTIPRFSKKFPFFGIERRKYTELTLASTLGDSEKLFLKVDCNLNILMKILKQEYTSWSKSTMTECVKGGLLQN